MPMRWAENAELFRAIAEYTYDWETWVDVAGEARWVNSAVTRITGYAVDECLVLPDYPRALAHPNDRALLARVLDDARRGGSGNDVEFRIVHKDGSTRWVAISYQAVRAKDGTPLGYRTSIRDIDERKRMEQELHVMRKRAEAAASARSELLANVSHELRSPAHCIAGFAELLLAGELEDAQRHQVDIIADQCRSMLRQVEDLLELAALEAGGVRLERSTFDLHQTLARLFEAAEPSVRARGLAFSYVITDVPRWLEGDASRLEQVLRNLLDNAGKFTESGGITLRAYRAPSRICLAVEDSGTGIEQSDVARLLQPFEQGDASTRRRRGGTGLGLAICQRLVQAMGGELAIESEPGKGTRVIVCLPDSLAVAQAPSELAPEQTTLDTVGRALVVDDSAVARELLSSMLALLGWRASEADSGEAALQLIASQDFDAIFLDYQMPDADGAETAVALRRVLSARDPERRVRIFLITANVFVREQLRSAREAIDAIVAKPLSRKALRQLLGGVGSSLSASESSEGPLDLEVVADLQATPTRSGHNMLVHFLPRVRTEQADELSRLREQLSQCELAEAARTAHRVAGHAAFVGARTAAALARRIELALASEQALGPESLRDLERSWHEALHALEQHLR